jgi:hypothetical protein
VAALHTHRMGTTESHAFPYIFGRSHQVKALEMQLVKGVALAKFKIVMIPLPPLVNLP